VLEFSTLVSAVKPRDRTDQYQVLAALYFLGAHEKPVAAKQISALLQLHFLKKAPRNVNASLRSYTAYVEVSTEGSSLRWTLTSKGLDRLRSLSSLALAVATTDSDHGADIAFICALAHPENAALVKALGGAERWSDAGSARFPHLYKSTELETANGRKLKVVATTSSSMGLTAAAIATTQLILQFRPKIVAMVGIAAGTHAGDKQFGDVLVADPSVDYNSGKVVIENGIRDFLPDPYPIGLNARLRSVLQKYRGTHSVFAKIREKWHSKLPRGQNRLHIGPLGAADQVIDDATRIIEIQRNWRKLIGIEMETYGVYRACHEAPDPKPRFVSFKAVCDFAAEKSDSWQEYASFCAAEFAVEFFRTEWEVLWQNPQGVNA
jgi:nucleoside phosphorylase